MSKRPANSKVSFLRDPDIPGVEVRSSSYTEEIFRPHTHAAWSISLVETGGTTFLLGSERHVMGAGQIALIPANAVHACNPGPDSEMTYRLFYVDTPLLEEAAGEVFGEPGVPEFRHPVVDDPPLFKEWRGLHLDIIAGAGKLEKQSRLFHCLTELISRHAAKGSPCEAENLPQAIALVCEHLRNNLSRSVTLDQLSELTGLSRCHLLRSFQRETGLPPHAFQNQLRVDRGKAQLAQGAPLGQLAAELGFADQSHFTRVFKRYTGATPPPVSEGNRWLGKRCMIARWLCCRGKGKT